MSAATIRTAPVGRMLRFITALLAKLTSPKHKTNLSNRTLRVGQEWQNFLHFYCFFIAYKQEPGHETAYG